MGLNTLQFEFEHELKHSRETLDFALKSGRMGTWEINLETKTIACSQEMLELWCVSPEEFNGERTILQKKVHPEDLEKMNSAIDAAIENDQLYELEYRIHPRPGEERWVFSRGKCGFSPGSSLPTRFSGVVFDITEKKMKEKALAQALESRDQFLMIASHELKTPLTCLDLQLQVQEWDLKHKYPEAFTKEKILSELNRQRQQIMRITRIIDNILDVSKISQERLQLHLEDFDLNAMVAEVLDRFSVTAKLASTEIKFDPEESVLGRWDRFRIEQVLLNLLMNALRYGNGNPVEVTVRKEENHALLIVKDQGTGILPEDQTRIFERFERAISTEKVRGLGLGLYISNRIVTAHGGTIRLESESGKGSKFSVILPIN